MVHEALTRLTDGRLEVGYHLDYYALWHVPGDSYARLSEAVAAAGGEPVNDPDRARAFTNKAVAHVELACRGLGVPHTIIVPPDAPDQPLTAAECDDLRLGEAGARIYVKPANGYGGAGVTRLDTATDLAAALRTARAKDQREAFLVQREVRCPHLADDDGVPRPAYWRILYCLGELLPYWWQKEGPERGRPSYRLLTREEIGRLHLRPVLSYVAELAELTGLEWFSTELCLSEADEPSRYAVRGADGRVRPVVAIDYVNDQCDVDVQSRWLGAPPDAMVRHAADRFAEAACRRRRILRFPTRQEDWERSVA